MNRVAIDLGVVQIYWYSICIIIGMAIGMTLVYREAKRKKINEDVIDVTVKRKVPEIGTCDMAECTVMFEISKEEAKNIKDVNLILK